MKWRSFRYTDLIHVVGHTGLHYYRVTSVHQGANMETGPRGWHSNILYNGAMSPLGDVLHNLSAWEGCYFQFHPSGKGTFYKPNFWRALTWLSIKSAKNYASFIIRILQNKHNDFAQGMREKTFCKLQRPVMTCKSPSSLIPSLLPFLPPSLNSFLPSFLPPSLPLAHSPRDPGDGHNNESIRATLVILYCTQGLLFKSSIGPWTSPTAE